MLNTPHPKIPTKHRQNKNFIKTETMPTLATQGKIRMVGTYF